MAATTIEPTPDAGERPAGKAKAESTAVAPAPPKPRVFWRAVVRSGGPAAIARDRERVEWHLVGCRVPSDAGVHCSEGMHLIETAGHPDGHCVIDGACGLCGAPAAE
jgi:hypothetical protein